jgi:hypothetical protein
MMRFSISSAAPIAGRQPALDRPLRLPIENGALSESAHRRMNNFGPRFGHPGPEPPGIFKLPHLPAILRIRSIKV